MAGDLVGAHEIADILGLSRQRVHKLAEHPDFPQPIARLQAGHIWERAAIIEWARRTGRITDDED